MRTIENTEADPQGGIKAQQRAAQAERLAAIGQVVASVAHESRNALQRILAHVELIEEHVGGDSEIMVDLHAIRSAAGSLTQMCEELREFSGELHLDLQLCSLEELIAACWDSLQQHPRQRESRLRVDVANISLWIDPLRMDQVLRNLLENSLTALDRPVSIRAHAVECRSQGVDVVQLTLSDNGPGFLPQNLDKVFEPFFTTKQRGTGLGLAICKRIVESHGGSIAIGDADSSGATVIITLPAMATEDPLSSQRTASAHW
ncbi:sensor histidine kinase [Novipirellula artificiosorum]|nr:ATP-binding protein [Novipirellula artificiosorum]